MIVNMDPRIVSVTVDDKIRVVLADGREVAIPLTWSPRLVGATAEQRQRVFIAEDGEVLRWPDVDEDIEVSAFLAHDRIIVFPPGDLLLKDDGSLKP